MQRASLLQALQAARLLQPSQRYPRGLQLLYSGISDGTDGSIGNRSQDPHLTGISSCLVSSAAFHSSPCHHRSQGQQPACQTSEARRRIHTTHANLAKDYYEILGVPRNASPSDLKKAYYALAKQYHPDANEGNAEAAKKFQEAGKAYDCLKDPKQRQIYDQVGPEAMEQGAGQAGADPFAGFGGPGGPFGGFSPGGGFSYSFGQGSAQQVDPEILEELFSSFGFRTPGGFGGRSRGASIRTRLRVSFMEAVNGCKKDLSISTSANSRDAQTYSVEVPAGIDEGATIEYRGGGMPSARSGGKPGDLHIEIEIEPHPRFQREGADIHVEAKVDFVDAILGGSITVPTLTGDQDIRIQPGTQSHEVLTLSGRGIALPSRRRGDMHVHLRVEIPRNLTARQRQLLQDFHRDADDPDEAQPASRFTSFWS